MSLLFKIFSPVEVTYLLPRFSKIKFFPWNTKNVDKNGVNKQNIHTHQTLRERLHWNDLRSIKKSDIPPFKKQPLILPTSPLFAWISKNHKGGGSNYFDVPVRLGLKTNRLSATTWPMACKKQREKSEPLF